jgi:hypothetical protein
MAALTITPAEVLPGPGASISRYTAAAGVTITAGQTIYDTTGSRVAALADCDALATAKVCRGIALNNAAPGQPINVLERGDIILGAAAVPTNGMPYFLSPTPGGISPLADLLTGDACIYLGVGIGNNTLAVQIHVTTAQVP